MVGGQGCAPRTRYLAAAPARSTPRTSLPRGPGGALVGVAVVSGRRGRWGGQLGRKRRSNPPRAWSPRAWAEPTSCPLALVLVVARVGSPPLHHALQPVRVGVGQCRRGKTLRLASDRAPAAASVVGGAVRLVSPARSEGRSHSCNFMARSHRRGAGMRSRSRAVWSTLVWSACVGCRRRLQHTLDRAGQ